MIARRWIVGACALTVVLGGCGDSPSAPAGSTLRATLADPDGDARLGRGPAEPLLDHDGRGPATRVLGTVAQIADAHVRDEESPARAPFLDRFGTPFESTFRPHEALTLQVLDAAVRAANAERPDAVLVSGDLVDSALAVEFDAALGVLGGGRVEPGSGAPGYDGVQRPAQPDPFYYRPDLDAPRHPGLLARAQAPFSARGLRAPWLPVVGNHDLLVAGELVPTPRLRALATGRAEPLELPAGVRPERGTDSAVAVEQVLSDPGVRTRPVAAEERRRILSFAEVLDRLRGARGADRAARTGADRLDYAADAGRGLRVLVLDLADRRGGAGAVVSPTQLAWLRAQLSADRVGTRRVLVAAHHPLPESVLRILDGAPAVAGAVTAHTHRHRILRRGRYWLISTASLADFPQQVRMVRLVDTRNGPALETWVVDHDGAGLAGTARALAYLDAQGGRPGGFAATRRDRNVRLALP